jgi:hypothetical protein
MVTTQELSSERTNEQQHDDKVTTSCEMDCCGRCGSMDHRHRHHECNASKTIYENYDFFSWDFLSKKRKSMEFDWCKRCGRFRPPFGDYNRLCLYPTNVFLEEEFNHNQFLRGARTQQMEEADFFPKPCVIISTTEEDGLQDPEELEVAVVCAR